MGHMGGYTDGLYDRNRNYDRDLIDAKRRQREHNTNEAIENLAKINANLSNKEKLIQLNENSRNPLNDGRPDYQYQRFQDQYAKRQKMINDNIDKYYPNMNNERPEIKSYYDKYVYNPNYDDKRNEGFNTLSDYRDNVPKNINKKDYIKDLENQINYKNELKRREKEEDKKREQQQYESLKEEMKREEEEKNLKEKKQKEELIKANNELINQKNKNKMKELEEKLKYKEYYDKENEEYKKELIKQKLENERKKKDMCNDNKNEYNNGFNKKHDYYNNKNDDKYNEHHIQKNEKNG
jgi:unconventional prefoldin RPB5 interactor 1